VYLQIFKNHVRLFVCLSFKSLRTNILEALIGNDINSAAAVQKCREENDI